MKNVPKVEGIYKIYLKDMVELKRIFKKNNLPGLNNFENSLLYIGITLGKGGLKKRLSAEILQKGNGTFFRTVGAILGERPYKNGKNYGFNGNSKERIISWMRNNLEIYYCLKNRVSRLETIEKNLIKKEKPLFNIKYNTLQEEPYKSIISEIKKMRKKLRNGN